MTNFFLGLGMAMFVVFCVAVAFGSPFAIAWLADSIYSHFWETPTSDAPQISYWWWVGIVYLFEFATGRGIRIERKVRQ